MHENGAGKQIKVAEAATLKILQLPKLVGVFHVITYHKRNYDKKDALNNKH